jgi:prefoldin alpha subunit
MENTQNIENQLYQFRIIKEQRDMFQGQLEIINASLGNLLNTKNTLQNIKDGVKENDELIIPIGGLVGIKALIQDTQKTLLFIGNDSVIERDISDSIIFIEKLIEQHNEQLKTLTERIHKLDFTIQGMSQSIQESYSVRRG